MASNVDFLVEEPTLLLSSQSWVVYDSTALRVAVGKCWHAVSENILPGDYCHALPIGSWGVIRADWSATRQISLTLGAAKHASRGTEKLMP